MLKSIVKALGGKKTLLSEAPASRVVADTFAIKRIAHYGSVSRPVLVKYDSLTHLTAVVGDDGGIKVYGTDGTEAYKRLPQNAALPSGLFFFGNEGSFIVHDSNCIYFFDTKQSTDLPYSTVPIEHGIASCDVALGEDVAVVGDCTGCIIGVVLSKCAVSEFKVPLSQVIPTPHEKDEDHATPSKADGTSDASPEAGTDSSSSSSSAKENAPVITVKANPVHPALLLVHYSLPYNFLCTWSVPAGKVLFTYNLAMMPLVTSLAWDKSGDKFAASHEDGSVSMWRCKDPKKPKCVFHAKDKVLKSDDEPPITEMNFARADSENMLVYLAGKGCTKRLCALRGDFENPSKVTAIEPFCSPVASYALVPPLKKPDPLIAVCVSGNSLFHVKINDTSVDKISSSVPSFPCVCSQERITAFSVSEKILLGSLPFSTLEKGCEGFGRIVTTGHSNGRINGWLVHEDYTSGIILLFSFISPFGTKEITDVSFVPNKNLLCFSLGDGKFFIASLIYSKESITEIVKISIDNEPSDPADSNENSNDINNDDCICTGPLHESVFPCFSVCCCICGVKDLPCFSTCAWEEGGSDFIAFSCSKALVVIDMETWSPVARRSFEKRFVTALNFVKSRTAPILLCGLDDGSLCAVQFLSGSIDPVELTSKCSLGPVLSMSLIDLQGNGVDCFINCKEEEDDESEKDTPAADISYVFVLCTHERGYDIVCLTLGADSAISVNDSCKSSKTKDGVLTSAIVSVDDINKCFCLLDNRMNIVGYDLFKCKKIFSDSLSTQKLPSLFCDSEKASDKDERSGSNSKDGYESTRNENSQENSIGEFCMCSNGQLFQVQKSFGKGLFIHSVLRGAEEHELHMCDSALLGDQKSKPSFFGKLFSGDIPVGRHLDEFFVPPKEKPRKSSSSSSSSSSSPSSRPPQSGATLRGDYANSPEDDQMSTLGALSESMDLLMKNQEKLNVIADKSNDLANNAEVFMKACEELAKNMK